MRVDKNGNELWRQRYGYRAPFSIFNNIFKTTDGNFICIGTTDSIYVHPSSGYMIKLNPNGNELWHRYYYAGMINEYYGNAQTFINNSFQTTDGGYFMCGSFFDSNHDYFNKTYTPCAIKTNVNGCDGWGSCDTNLRVSQYGISNYFNDTLCYLDDIYDYTDSLINFQIYDTLCRGDRVMVEFQILGGRDSMNYTADIYKYTGVFGEYPYGQEKIATYYNLKDSTKYYYLTEPKIKYYNNPGWGINSPIWFIIVHYDYGPDIFGGFGLPMDTTCSVGINELFMSNNLLNVYPNPATAQITVEYSFKEWNYLNNKIMIYNVLGEKVKEVLVTEKIGYSEIKVDNLPNGNYIVSLGGNKDFSTKFSINR